MNAVERALGIFCLFELSQGRQKRLFFFLPFGGFRLPKFFTDYSVQAVHISLLQPPAQLGQPLVYSFGLALPERFLVGFIGKERLLKLRRNVIQDADRLQGLTEALGHHLFAKVRQIAFAPVTCAAVIGVLLLLEIGCHRTIVIGTPEQTRKCELVYLFARPRFAGQHVAHPREYFKAHKGSITALYWYLFRYSIARTGNPLVRMDMPALRKIAKSTKSNAVGSMISEEQIRSSLRLLTSIGAIRSEGEPNREGTPYRVLIPGEIEACREYRRKRVAKEEKPPQPSQAEADFYNVKENRLEVYERDEYKCRYCGRQLTRFTYTLDHVTPVAAGGTNSLDNLVTACITCHSKKHQRPVGDFLVER